MPLKKCWPQIFILLATGFFTQTPSNAGQPVPEDFSIQARLSAEDLQNWYDQNGLWNSTGWWNAANCLDAIEGMIGLENGEKYSSVIRKTFERNSQKKFLNDYYDDEGWWALAWIRAFDVTGEPRYLALAGAIFEDLQGGWDDHCGGGIWWRKNTRYKNAIANELFLLVAVRLSERTGDNASRKIYLNWAQREWNWFEASGMINSNHLVNDGLDDNCENNRRRTWTYNQGVLIGGLTELYRATGENRFLSKATILANAAMTQLVDDHGILAEPDEPQVLHGADVPQFKGIFIQHLAGLYEVTASPSLREFLVRNADSVWRNARNGSNQLGGRWSGPFDAADAARQSSALQLFIAVAGATTTNDLPAFTWAAANLTHEVGRLDTHGNWSADPLQEKAGGVLVKLAKVKDLPPGKSEARFEMKVDNFNRDSAIVAQISVIDSDSQTTNAFRAIKRSEFPNVLYQTFAVPFECAAGHHYDLQMVWKYFEAAPRLTVRQISLRPIHLAK